MADHLGSVDCGNGGTNGVLAEANGKVKSYFSPTFRAPTDGQTLVLDGGIKTMDYEWVKWNGQKYVVGDTAMRLNSDSVETHRGINRYGNEFQQFHVAHALAKLGIKDGTVHLVLFCPPGLYAQVADNMKKQFMSSPVEIQLSGDKKPRSWKYEKVTVLPEGVGAAACVLFDQHGNAKNADVMAGRFLVMDGGVQTFDVLEFTNGSLNPNSLQHATYPEGMYKHIMLPILTHYQKSYSYLNIGHVDAAIRKGLVTGEFILDPDNIARDIGEMVERLSEKYAGYLSNNIIDGDYDGLNSVRLAYPIGGWDNLCGKYIRNWYGEKIIDSKKVDTIRKLDPVDINAVGGLRFVLAMANRQKA